MAAPRRWQHAKLTWAGGVVLLGILIVALHGRSLNDGLFMDDHAHFTQLRDCDWSLKGLADACRLELVGGAVELWWLPEVTLRFFRPVAFGFMKLLYTLTGWDPRALHIASLVWHLLVASLMWVLLWRLGIPRGLAWATTAIFTIHPGHVATVQWIACQTELMVTALLLGATLCWARLRGWSIPGARGSAGVSPVRVTGTGQRPALPGEPNTHTGQRPALPGESLRPGMPSAGGSTPGSGAWIALAITALVLFALALGCRENAIMFPFVMAAAEPFARRRGVRSTIVLYGALAVLVAVYLVVRAASLGGMAVPPRPYVVGPSEPDFVPFIINKALYHMLGQFLFLPVVPIAGQAYLVQRPWLFYPPGVLVVIGLAYVVWRHRREPAGILAPAWLLGFTAPLLPVFAAPHHLYLPGVGWAIVAALLLRWIAGEQGTRVRRAVAWTCAVLLGGALGVWTYYLGLTIAAGQSVEDRFFTELASYRDELTAGDTLYLANVPLVGHYADIVVQERTGLPLRVIALTWSPRVLGITEPAECRWIDDRTVEFALDEQRYFAGPFKLIVREFTGRDVPDDVDCRATLGFRVRVLERDGEGIKRLRFEFVDSLADPHRHLFWGSRTRWAARLRAPENAE